MENKCIPVEVSTFEDLIRFTASMRSFGQNSYILHFKNGKRHVYGVFVVFRDYYKFYGLPLFYYIERVNPIQERYILVKVDEKGEAIEVSNGVKSGWIPIPIISLKEKPDIIPSLKSADF